MSRHLQDSARAIFADTLAAVDVASAVRREIDLPADSLTLAGRSISLTEVDDVVIVAMGKAAVPMYLAAAGALRHMVHRAVVVGPVETLPIRRMDVPEANQVQFLPGSHPTPDAQSLRAAQAIQELLAGVTRRTVVLFLVSGGASAMVEQPLSATVSLHDMAEFSRALVGSGLDITAMNTLRKHMSAVKGGRLAQVAAGARMQCSLLISDVPTASPDAIGSGPSLPDSSTAARARELFGVLRNDQAIPNSIQDWFDQTALPESPKAADEAFARAHWKVVLSSEHLTLAAAEAAERAGFHTVVDNSCDDWEYRRAAHYLLDRSRLIAATAGQQPTCLVSVGEVAVALSPSHGEGGRNQQFALWCAKTATTDGQRVTVLSAGSDGVDGHSQAAGAVCDESTVERARVAGWRVHEALQDFNTAPLLRVIGDAVHTGPTGNNLRDLRLFLTGA